MTNMNWKLRIGIAVVLLAAVQGHVPAADHVPGRLDEVADRLDALEARIAALEAALEGMAGAPGAPPGGPAMAVPGAAAGAAAGAIDINSPEGIARLTEVPGIGPVLAERIAEALPVARMTDLLRVRGVGAARLEALLDFGYYAEGDVRPREPGDRPADPEPPARPADEGAQRRVPTGAGVPQGPDAERAAGQRVADVLMPGSDAMPGDGRLADSVSRLPVAEAAGLLLAEVRATRASAAEVIRWVREGAILEPMDTSR